MATALVVDRLGALAAVEQLGPITIDYPEEGSIFPPEITAPTFFGAMAPSARNVGSGWRQD